VSTTEYEPRPPYEYRRAERDDPRGEKCGSTIEHQVIDREGTVAGRFLTEGAARYWTRVMNEYHNG
jgi:hypothetical protein